MRSSSEKKLVKANCLAWFNNYRPVIRQTVADDLLQDTDDQYKEILSGIDHATSRARYDELLKQLRGRVSEIRGYTVTPQATAQPTTDAPPSFSALVSDPAMQDILGRRWLECAKCVSADAPLAATVMMGGLLEALLLARVHHEQNKRPIFQAVSSPKEKGSGKTLPLQEWTLRHYIDVAHELGWITASAKDVGAVVRDYRNYIHPHKELTHGAQLKGEDARLFWEISKNIARQVLNVEEP